VDVAAAAAETGDPAASSLGSQVTPSPALNAARGISAGSSAVISTEAAEAAAVEAP
jgi:hypothetical protein